MLARPGPGPPGSGASSRSGRRAFQAVALPRAGPGPGAVSRRAVGPSPGRPRFQSLRADPRPGRRFADDRGLARSSPTFCHARAPRAHEIVGRRKGPVPGVCGSVGPSASRRRRGERAPTPPDGDVPRDVAAGMGQSWDPAFRSPISILPCRTGESTCTGTSREHTLRTGCLDPALSVAPLEKLRAYVRYRIVSHHVMP